MLRFRLIAGVAVAIGMLAAGPARAQSNATLSGTVTDAQNAVMPGVSITVHNSATNQERNVVTDAEGQYAVAALAPGTYVVTAHLEGFTDQKREVPLGPAQVVGLNLKLSVGALSENVTVTGSSPLIDTATVAVGASMAEKTVQEIPLNGRHFVDLGPLMPGGSTSPQNAGLSAPLRGQGGFSFMTAGNRETSVNFMVNGINL
ncbi:MAG TPA: carboxypeptidase-like regulatory domain-containing protein, partial [Vicinamibacterales bacterium]|nr:carboxypeptidase-like regulatory domain-containing protein [Vicinamibacterales bacterium]